MSDTKNLEMRSGVKVKVAQNGMQYSPISNLEKHNNLVPNCFF